MRRWGHTYDKLELAMMAAIHAKKLDDTIYFTSRKDETMTTPTPEQTKQEKVPAFTEEQIRILTIAFEYTWERIKRFQNYIDGDGMRQAAMMNILLRSKGVVSPKDVAVINGIYVEASSLVKADYACADEVWSIMMESILQGDLAGVPRIKVQLQQDGEPDGEDDKDDSEKGL